ncbi:leucine-rich repeat-containing protein 37A3-like [Oryctolagus cuniculus]|uniref:leucine-rich repeat-containing protein 37A3-like n=1 Tax=Oryctolagus cuniculus TaxID=9986 RepID=UPI00387933CD
MEGQTQNPETQEPIQSSSPQQEGQAPPPQPVEPDELSSPQQEGPGADLQQPEEEASPLQQEAPAQNPFATAEVAGQASVYHDPNTPSSPQIVALQANFPSVTLKPADTELTEASGAGEEVQSTPSTEQAPAQPLGHPEGVGLPSAQQEAPEQTPEFPGKVQSWTQEGLAQTSALPEETGPFSTQNDATAQPSEYAEEVSPSIGQQGAPAQSPGLPVNTEYSSSNQEQPAQPSESPEIEPSRSQLEAPEKPSALPVEVKSPVQQDPRAQALESPEETIIAQTPQIQKGMDWSPDQNQVHRYNLPNVTIKPADVALTITPEPTMERDSSPAQQEGSAQTPGPPVETEPSLREQQQIAQYAEALVETQAPPGQLEALALTPVPPMETEPYISEQEQPRRPSESSEEVESSGKKTEVPAQPPSHHTVTILPPGHHQVQQYDLPNVTTKPPDLQLTLTPKPAARPAPRLTRLILRLAAPAHRVLVPVGAPDSVPVAPLPGQLSAVARECSGGWPRCLGPAPHGRPGKAPGSWLLPSDQCGAPAAARRPRRPLEGEPTTKEDLSLCLSLSLSTLPVKKKKKKKNTCRSGNISSQPRGHNNAGLSPSSASNAS